MELSYTSPIRYSFIPIPKSTIIFEFKLKESKNRIKVNVNVNIYHKDQFAIGRVSLTSPDAQNVYTSPQDTTHRLEFKIPEFQNCTQSYIHISMEPIGDFYNKVIIEDMKISEVKISEVKISEVKISEVKNTVYKHPNTAIAIPNLGPKIGNLQELKDIVVKGYRDILRRDPDQIGLDNYTNQLKNGLGIENFHDILKSSDEYKNRFRKHETVNIQTNREIEKFKEGQKVVISSIVRNEEQSGNLSRFLDCCKELEQYNHNLAYIFIEGDSSDRTHEILKNFINERKDSILEKIDKGYQPFGKTKDPQRTAHLAKLRNRLIDIILSIPNVAEVLMIDANYGWKGDLIRSLRDVNAGIAAPLVVSHKDNGGRYVFYDIWVFRKNGKEFWPLYPYAEGMRFDSPVDVDSVGGGYLVKRQVLEAGARYNGDQDSEQVGFCNHARSLGFSIKVNPSVYIRKGGYKE